MNALFAATILFAPVLFSQITDLSEAVRTAQRSKSALRGRVGPDLAASAAEALRAASRQTVPALLLVAREGGREEAAVAALCARLIDRHADAAIVLPHLLPLSSFDRALVEISGLRDALQSCVERDGDHSPAALQAYARAVSARDAVSLLQRWEASGGQLDAYQGLLRALGAAGHDPRGLTEGLLRATVSEAARLDAVASALQELVARDDAALEAALAALEDGSLASRAARAIERARPRSTALRKRLDAALLACLERSDEVAVSALIARIQLQTAGPDLPRALDLLERTQGATRGRLLAQLLPLMHLHALRTKDPNTPAALRARELVLRALQGSDPLEVVPALRAARQLRLPGLTEAVFDLAGRRELPIRLEALATAGSLPLTSELADLLISELGRDEEPEAVAAAYRSLIRLAGVRIPAQSQAAWREWRARRFPSTSGAMPK
ncbi:MAG: hypothetical protein AB7N76_13805 [Planctomycetota bacterium]